MRSNNFSMFDKVSVLVIISIMMGVMSYSISLIMNVESLAVNAQSVNINLYAHVDLPDPPDCKDFGIPDCDWDYSNTDLDKGFVELNLTNSKGTVSRVQLLEVDAGAMHEFSSVYRGNAWIGHVEVAKGATGNGIGRATWRAGDVLLRQLKPGAVRVLTDGAGWGQSLMRGIPRSQIIWTEAPYWIYLP